MKAALICVLLGGSAIGYVYQKNQIFDLGRQIQKSEQRLKVVRDNNAKLQKALLTMQSSTQLEKRVRELNLDLVQPAQSQIVTILEVPATAAPPRNEPLFDEPRAIAALK